VSDAPPSRLLRSKLFWVGVLYFAQGFPFGVFYDVLPVYFRQTGIDLREIGFLSLLGLAWTIKFLWAPAVDYYRYHRRWMAAVDLGMGAALVFLAAQAGFGPSVWLAIALFTLLSATNDIAIDGYTIELLDRNEYGLANGVRIGLARVGILTAGVVLILSDYLGWPGAFTLAAAIIATFGFVCLFAPREVARVVQPQSFYLLRLLAAIAAFTAATGITYLAMDWLAAQILATAGGRGVGHRGLAILLTLFALVTVAVLLVRRVPAKSVEARGIERAGAGEAQERAPAAAPLFDALAEMLRRPHVVPVVLFVLTFKLGDASMGFMVKPFWVDSGFSATQIGLVSVNIGLLLSIAGGVAGGWFTDRVGIFKGLWTLGLLQAASNLGYVAAAQLIPPVTAGATLTTSHFALMYAASALESFTGGLGTAAFLAFLMAIVDKRYSATEYALLSSLFALTRHLAGYASGFGAHHLGYAPYFLLTFFLSFPAYALLPWVRKALAAAPRD
jgi:PAT family beta-lactamase induction signal transducer AmpG